MNMIVSTAIAGTTVASALSDDPIFAAIENHKGAIAALEAGLEVMYALEDELPKELRRSNIDAWEEEIVETDDPRWIESEKNVHALHKADQEVALG